MLNLPLLKRTIKTNGKLWMLFFVLLILETLLMMGGYRSEAGTGMDRMLRAFPESMAALFGIRTGAAALEAYLASNLFGFVFPVIAMVYGMIAADRLIAKEIESGMMAYLLATPNKRAQIANTQAYFLVMSLFVMFFCTTILGLVYAAVCFPGKMDAAQFILLNIGCFCLQICLSGIGFLVSCISDGSRVFRVIGAGVPLLFLLLKMFSNTGGILGVMRFVTVFSLFDTEGVLQRSLHICWSFPLLAVMGLLMYRAGIKLFEKRDLPL